MKKSLIAILLLSGLIVTANTIQRVGFLSGAWKTAFSNTGHNTDTADRAGYSYRQLVGTTSTSLSAGGNKCRVTFKAAATAGSMTVDHVSIGERDGTSANTLAAPVEVKFSGASGFTISAGQTITSDEVAFQIIPTGKYLVIWDMNASAGNYMRWRTGYAPVYAVYSKSATASWDQQTVAGFTGPTDTVHYTISLFEVK